MGHMVLLDNRELWKLFKGHRVLKIAIMLLQRLIVMLLATLSEHHELRILVVMWNQTGVYRELGH